VEERDPLTQEVIGAAIEVHREMGPGSRESVYQRCLDWELQTRRMEFHPQHRLPLSYKGKLLDEVYVLDFIFPNRLIIELKAVEKLLPVHEAQLLSYMRMSKTPLGLLINFNVPVLKNGVKRMIL
jgi:GxxExxY protein